MKNFFRDYVFQEGSCGIISYAQCQDAVAFTEGKIAQICSEEALIMLLLLLWNLVNELVLRGPSKQLFPVSWNRSSVRTAYSRETSSNTRVGLLHFVSLCF